MRRHIRAVGLAALGSATIWTILSSVTLTAGSTTVGQSELVVAAKPMTGNPSPAYPEQARMAGVEGQCIFRADVTTEGAVSGVSVLQVPQAGVGFEEAVQEAVTKWRFQPARRGSAPTTWVYVGKVNYSLLAVNHGRMYSVSASVAWSKLRDWLALTGMKVEKADQPHQMILTKLTGVRGAPLPFPSAVGDGYTPRRFQFQVFVSPYAEPARMYVASAVEAERDLGGKTETRIFYNSSAPSTWLLQQFSRYLGDPGRAMPETFAARTALAAQLGKGEGGVPCSPRSPAGAPTPPVKFYDVTPTYPPRLLLQRHRGQVRFEFDVQEDGAVRFTRFLDTLDDPSDQPFFDAASAAVSFWRFEPTRLGGCPVPVVASAVTRFDFK